MGGGAFPYMTYGAQSFQQVIFIIEPIDTYIMKRFIEWLTVSEWGLLITIVSVAVIIITLMAFFPRPSPIIIDGSMMTVLPEVGSHETETRYEEVIILNGVEYKATMDSLGITHVYYYDWEETANALDIAVDCLTVALYMQHIKGEQ